MNARAARRLATQRLAQSARQLCADMGFRGTTTFGLSYADTERMVQAYAALAHELDVRTGAVPREPRPAPVDPAQEQLFMIEPGGRDDE